MSSDNLNLAYVRTWLPRIAIVLHDLSMVALAWLAVYWVRYLIGPQDLPVPVLFAAELPVVLGAQGIVLYLTGLYRGLWRFASLPDLWNIIRASVLGTLLIAISLFLVSRLEGVPRSALIMYPVVLVVLLGVPRLVYRMWKDHGLRFHARPNRNRVLILGAGSAGEMLARDLRRENGDYCPIGFLDDERSLHGANIRGLPIFGSIERLPHYVRSKSVDMVIIAVPSASNEQMQRIVSVCELAGVSFRTVPRLQDMVAGRLNYNQIKDVAIEDLLGREPVQLDWRAIGRGISAKSVVVTGGGGSIGSELCRQIARLDPANLVILDNNEYNLYEIDAELRRKFPELVLKTVLGDAGDRVLINRVFEQNSTEAVFHAAAYKHVPLLQQHLREAVRNNVLGTQIVAEAADRYQVDTFVLISTDKAVNPANLMGASKRAAEIICQSWAARSSTRFVTVRFGNVLDSAGSVVPLFRRQISSGGPVTVTHPDITRYFMTIPEATQLILQAAAMGADSGIYVLDMGEPVRIQYLAEQMIRLAGKLPHDDIEIVYTGLRDGEKLFEELFHEKEPYQQTEHPQITRAQHRDIDWQRLTARVDELQAAVRTFDEPTLETLLRALVPELADKKQANVINLAKAIN